jgi:Cu/Ag efflux protein CusF
MKTLLLLTGMLLGQFAFASEPPADYPVVKGIVRKVELNSGRVSIKHEEIPNLDMPGMTMSFLAQDPQILQGLAVGDKILFVADEVDGELAVLWIEKAPAPNVDNANILCTGIGNTTPKTSVEIEVRRDKYSTIRYEHIEGPYPGTAHVNSIGHLKLHKRGDFYIYRRGVGEQNTKLIFRLENGQIVDSCFSNFNASMENAPVKCEFQ